MLTPDATPKGEFLDLPFLCIFTLITIILRLAKRNKVTLISLLSCGTSADIGQEFRPLWWAPIQGSTMRLFYFRKMRVKILYWSPDGELIFSEHFHSITDRFFHFKIRLWFSDLLDRTIDSDIKVLNRILLMLASDHDQQKSKTCIQNFSLKIKLLN